MSLTCCRSQTPEMGQEELLGLCLHYRLSSYTVGKNHDGLCDQLARRQMTDLFFLHNLKNDMNESTLLETIVRNTARLTLCLFSKKKKKNTLL